MTKGTSTQWVPKRTCIGCRAVCPAPDLLRLIAPDGHVRFATRRGGLAEVLAASGRRGRGAWVHPHCFAATLERNTLGRAFRRQIEVLDRKALLAEVHAAPQQSTNAQGDSR